MVDSPSGIKACPRCIAGVTPSHEPEPLIWQFCIGPVGPNDRGWCECTESKARAFLAHGAPFVVRALRVVPITDGVAVLDHQTQRQSSNQRDEKE